MSQIPRPASQAKLLTPAQIADAFNVDVKTIARWAKQGKLKSIRTPGGHRRYDPAEVQRYLSDWR